MRYGYRCDVVLGRVPTLSWWDQYPLCLGGIKTSQTCDVACHALVMPRPLVALVGSGLGLGRVVTYSVMYLTGSKSTTFRGDQIMHRHGVGVGLDVGFFRTPCPLVPIHTYLWEPIPAGYFWGITLRATSVDCSIEAAPSSAVQYRIYNAYGMLEGLIWDDSIILLIIVLDWSGMYFIYS